MTGKRHNQYEVDPGSPAATNEQTNPGTRDQGLRDRDKSMVANSQADARQGDNLIPQGGVNPALAELRARNDRAAADARGDHNRGGGLHGGAGSAQHVDTSPDAGIEVRGAERGGERGAERADDAERTE